MTDRTTPDLRESPSEETPARDLDVYHNAIKPTSAEDDFLARNNLGLGYVEDSEMWQQLQRYHDGMYSAAAFGETIIRRAIEETKRQIALEGESFYDEHNMEPVSIDGWHDLDDDEQLEQSRQEYVEQKGEEAWQRMSDEQRKDALEVASGIDREWSPPHHRILVAQHEISRSRGARLMDNLFGRETKRIIESSDDDAANRLLGGGR